MKAYRFFWRAYAVILLMIRHYLIAARLSDGRAYQVIHVLLVLWAIHALLSQLYLWLQARRAAQGREPMLSDASPVRASFYPWASPPGPSQALWRRSCWPPCSSRCVALSFKTSSKTGIL